jgi:hypothetical protein
MLKPGFAWTVHRAAAGGTTNSPDEVWRIHPPAYFFLP